MTDGNEESRYLRRPAASLVARARATRGGPRHASSEDDLAEHRSSRRTTAPGWRRGALGGRKVLLHKRPRYAQEPQPGRESEGRAVHGAPRPRPGRRGPGDEGDRPGNARATGKTVRSPGLARSRR